MDRSKVPWTLWVLIVVISLVVNPIDYCNLIILLYATALIIPLVSNSDIRELLADTTVRHEAFELIRFPPRL